VKGVSWSDRVLSKAERNRLLKPDIIIQASVGARSEFSRVEGAMAAVRKWQFKAKFRANTYGWRASSLAISRLKEAACEIRSVAKSDPVAAGDGAVSLMERIWPAFQGIDTSSGALGAAVFRTINELIPILAVAPADHTTRSKWLERLFEAVQNDGVEYLAPLEDRWGEIAQYPDLIDEYADRMIGMVRRAWADHQTFQHVIGTSICLPVVPTGSRPLRRTSRTAGHATDEVLVLEPIRRRGSGSPGIVGSRDRVRRSRTQQHKSWLLRNIHRSVL
jgi:hypothetical protein